MKDMKLQLRHTQAIGYNRIFLSISRWFSSNCQKVNIIMEFSFYALAFVSIVWWATTPLVVSLEAYYPPPLTRIAQGNLFGSYLVSRSGRAFAAFRGIPFTSFTERFEAPLPPEKFIGAFNATSYGARCPQLDGLNSYQEFYDEDCLYLNVFVPKKFPIVASYLLPVMVYIESGGFQFGGADRSGPNYFMDEEVVLVTFNYRMNAFGFISTGDSVAPGNVGLKDQVMALTWVQKNIINFGGNPRSVTLFGESAGGTSVTLHLMSPLSKGLFHKAICQSGSALKAAHFTEDLVPATNYLAERLLCPTTKTATSSDLIQCLKSKTVSDILQALIPIGNILEETTQVFVPTLERGLETEEGTYKSAPNAFLPDIPLNILRYGKFHKIPLIMTVTKDEGLFAKSALIIKSPVLLEELNQKFFDVAPIAFDYAKFNLPATTRNFISSKLLDFYFNDNAIDILNFEKLTAVYSDSFVISATKTFALLYAKSSPAPVYTGVFAIPGIYSQISKYGYRNPLGMGHSDDLQYFFNNELDPVNFAPGSRLERFSKEMVRAWVNFARTGNPQLHQFDVSWTPIQRTEIETGDINWLYLDTHLSRNSELLRKRLKLWDFINSVIEFESDNTY